MPTKLQEEVARRLAAVGQDENTKRLAENAERLRKQAEDRKVQRLRDEQQRGYDNLRRLQLKSAERDADRLKWNERLKWAAAGNHPADFDDHWPEIRAKIALAMVDGGAVGGAAVAITPARL